MHWRNMICDKDHTEFWSAGPIPQSESPSSPPTAPTAPANSSSLPRRRSPGRIKTDNQWDAFVHLERGTTGLCDATILILLRPKRRCQDKREYQKQHGCHTNPWQQLDHPSLLNTSCESSNLFLDYGSRISLCYFHCEMAISLRAVWRPQGN